MKKRKLWVSILAGLMAFVMLLALVISILPASASAASSAEIKEKIKELEADQAALGEQMEELAKEQDSNWDSIEDMVEQKNNIDQQINLMHTELANISEQIRNYSLLIAENQTQLDEAQQVLADLNAKHKERIRAMEEEGEISYWSVLFKANSFMDLLDRMNMVEEIHAADQRRLKELSAAAQAVEYARQELESEKTALEFTRQELTDTQAQLEEKRVQADELLSQLNDKKRELDALEEDYLQQEEDISAQIAANEKAYTDAVRAEEEAKRQQEQQNNPGTSGGSSGGGSSTPSSGGWVSPCSYTALTSSYGWRIHPITGKESFHNGVDLANVEGTPIYAAKSGTVTAATSNGVYGYYVTINHGDGFSSLYAHMTHFIVSEGQYVSAGQLIGYMGSTGWSTGPHLHFTIYYEGNTVNPMNYI